MPSEESRERALEKAPVLFLTDKELTTLRGGAKGSHVTSGFIFLSTTVHGEYRWESQNGGHTVLTP